jgi:serine O-acetyltransferase
MLELIKYIRERDPAKPTFMEVVLAYPGFHAVGLHRVGHFLWRRKLRALARVWSHLARFLTGIEIHPGATIGKNLFIDHGMGTVIGETAVIEDNVTLYHGVTLGGKGGSVTGKRHPTLRAGCIVGAGAQVLGDITVGIGAKVGANAVVNKSIPEGCVAVGNPARLLTCEKDDGKAYGMPREWVDPVAEVIDGLLQDVEQLKKKSGLQKSADEPKETYAEHWKGSGI